MGTIEITVNGMTCDGCERSVANALGRLDGVSGVTADHSSGRVVITGEDPPSPDQIRSAVEDAGYEVRS